VELLTVLTPGAAPVSSFELSWYTISIALFVIVLLAAFVVYRKKRKQ